MRDVRDLYEFDSVRALFVFVALCEAATFFRAGFDPEMPVGTFQEGRVFNCFPCIGMDGTEGKL